MRDRLFTTLFLMCFFAYATLAQTEATVKSFTLTTDHIPSNDRRNDLNGDPCALVKVQVLDEIDRIEGNRIGNIEKRGVEKWIYMCKGSRNMRVHLANHLPVRVMFQDYDINGLESNRVYELIIEIPDAPKVNNTQKLILNYTPTNATVIVDSKLCRGNGRIELELPAGDHHYIIAADGYITAESTIKLNGNVPREITEMLVSEYPSVDNQIEQVIASETPEVPNGVKTVNYRFDFSAMKIGSLSANDYFVRKIKTGNENPFDGYNSFLREIEQKIIYSANHESMIHKGYIFSNSENSVIEVIISIKQIDEDGEHDVYGVVVDKMNRQEITRVKVHAEGGRKNDVTKYLSKTLRKTGEKLGDKLADSVLKKIKGL